MKKITLFALMVLLFVVGCSDEEATLTMMEQAEYNLNNGVYEWFIPDALGWAAVDFDAYHNTFGNDLIEIFSNEVLAELEAQWVLYAKNELSEEDFLSEWNSITGEEFPEDFREPFIERMANDMVLWYGWRPAE